VLAKIAAFLRRTACPPRPWRCSHPEDYWVIIDDVINN